MDRSVLSFHDKPAEWIEAEASVRFGGIADGQTVVFLFSGEALRWLASRGDVPLDGAGALTIFAELQDVIRSIALQEWEMGGGLYRTFKIGWLTSERLP